MVVAVRSLDEIAESIRAHWSATEEDRFAIGHDLMEARARFPSNREFGAWMEQQGLPFAREMARMLRLGAENEPEVRAALATQVANGRHPNFLLAVRTVLPPKPRETPRGRPAGQRRRPIWWRVVMTWLHRVRPEDRRFLSELLAAVQTAIADIQEVS